MRRSGPAGTWRRRPPRGSGPAWCSLVLGLLTRRPDVAALGVPLLLGFARAVTAATRAALVRPADRCRTSPSVRWDDGGDRARSGRPGSGVLALRVDAPGHRATEALVAAHARDDRGLDATVRTGRRELFRLDHRESGPDLLLTTAPVPAPPVTHDGAAADPALGQLPLPFRLQGLTGQHGRGGAGDGGDLQRRGGRSGPVTGCGGSTGGSPPGSTTAGRRPHRRRARAGHRPDHRAVRTPDLRHRRRHRDAGDRLPRRGRAADRHLGRRDPARERARRPRSTSPGTAAASLARGSTWPPATGSAWRTSAGCADRCRPPAAGANSSGSSSGSPWPYPEGEPVPRERIPGCRPVR